MRIQDSWWTVPVASLVIIVPAVLVLVCKQTDSHTHRQSWMHYSCHSQMLVRRSTSLPHHGKGKSKRRILYSASSWEPRLKCAQVWITQCYLPITPHLHLPRSSPGGATTEWTLIAPADEAYYSFIDPVRMKGWVGLVGWPTAECLPI